MSDRVEWVREGSALAALAHEWPRLAGAVTSPFLRHEWLMAWWDAFGTGVELCTPVVRRDDALVGALPLVSRGRRLEPAANRHTQVFGALVRDDHALRSLCEAVAARAQDEIALSPVGPREPVVAGIDQELRERGWFSFQEHLRRSPFVDTQGDFDAYLSERLSSATRRGLRRSWRRLQAEHGAVAELIVEPQDVESAVGEALDLEAAGWKGRDGTAMRSRPDTDRFMRRVASGFHTAGNLRLSTIRVDGRLAAFELGVLTDGRLWSMKTSYAEALGRYSPGRVLRLLTIERCFELGLTSNEMLGGDDVYKRSMATGGRDWYTYRAFRRAPVPLSRLLYRRQVRPAMKRMYLRAGGYRARVALGRAARRGRPAR